MKIQVKNMTSPNGNFVPNQFIIKAGNFENHSYIFYFQSYKTIIAKIDETTEKIGEYGPEITLDTNALNYSRTTSKYLYKFLGMNRKEIMRKIETLDISLRDLN